MKLLALSILITYALAARVNIQKRASPINVKLEAIGNSAVKASLTNTGSEPLKLVKTGSVLDSIAVEKAEIYTGSDQIPFDGIRLSLKSENLGEASFQTLAAGETVDVEWDPAEVHDLSAGGDFDFVVRGSFLTADPDTNNITGVVPYDSDALPNHVDGPTAAKVRRDFHDNIKRKLRAKRADVANDCTGARGQAQLKALTNCEQLATGAARAASNGSAAKMTEYFKSSSSSTRSTVADVFTAIANECGSTTAGISDQYCTDVMDYCEPVDSVLAYTLPSQDVMVSCPLYFNELPALATGCHRQDQASTTLHEATHLRQIRGTNDYGYGYSAIQQLSASQALDNADTYTLFANAISVGC